MGGGQGLVGRGQGADDMMVDRGHLQESGTHRRGGDRQRGRGESRGVVRFGTCAAGCMVARGADTGVKDMEAVIWVKAEVTGFKHRESSNILI